MSVDAPAEPPQARGKTPRSEPRDDGVNRDLANLLTALSALCAGDFRGRLEPRDGLMGQVVGQRNALATLHERRTRELVRAGRVMNLERHLTRLATSAQMLDLPAPDSDSWRHTVATAVDRWSALSTGAGLLPLFPSRGRQRGCPPPALEAVGPGPGRAARGRAGPERL